jgi:hypothetical protein
VPDELHAKQRHFCALYDVILEGKYVLRMTSFRRCYLSCKFIHYCKKIVMDEMTLISMNKYLIEVNHFKYETSKFVEFISPAEYWLLLTQQLKT